MGRAKIADETHFVGVTLPQELYERIAEAAEEAERSVAAQVRFMLKRFTAR